MRLSRRDLLRSALAAGVATMFPYQLSAAGALDTAGDYDRYLILVELDGGNDGLNMFTPADTTVYYQRREVRNPDPNSNNGVKLGIPPSKLRQVGSTGHASFDAKIKMNWNLVDGTGSNRLKDLATQGELAVVLGLGMADPSRSHFRGIDIWNTGSISTATLNTGWLQRALNAGDPRPSTIKAEAALLSRPTSNPLVGGNMRVLSMRNAEDFVKQSQGLVDPSLTGTAARQHVLNIQKQVVGARTQFETQFGWVPPVGDGSGRLTTLPTFSGDTGESMFPAGDFGNQCRWAAQLIAGGVGVPVIKIRIGGFDNHSSQYDKHNDLLAQLAHGLTGLRNALQQKGKLTRSLIMTYSEFGRRIEGNNSGGTDHGTAAPHFMIGHSDNLNSGVYGTYPSLGNPAVLTWNDPALFQGDFIATMQFHQYLATALNFLGLPHTQFSPATTPIAGLLKA